MKTMTISGIPVLGAPQVVRLIEVVSAEASRGDIVVVAPTLCDAVARLTVACGVAARGGEGVETLLRELENPCFQIIRACVGIRRQSAVLANAKFVFNQVDELLHGIGLLRELSPRILDTVLSHAEWLSAYVVFEAAREAHPEARLLDTREILLTDDHFGRASIRHADSRRRIQDFFAARCPLTVATGSIGATERAEPTTFGRGGSEYVAAALAAALQAEEVVIWTDTDGVLTADPRMVPEALPILRMTYAEAMELMHFGDGFIYPPAVIPAIKSRIPLRVRNLWNLQFDGTVIGDTGGTGQLTTGISSTGGIALLQIQGSGMVGVTGVAVRLFRALADGGINVILISQASSEHSICVGIVAGDAVKAETAVKQEFRRDLDLGLVDDVSVEKDLCILAVVGEGMKRRVGLAAKIFGALCLAGVNVKAIAQGSSELNISIVIDGRDQAQAMRALHREMLQDRQG